MIPKFVAVAVDPEETRQLFAAAAAAAEVEKC
jgi:hypothetical protein